LHELGAEVYADALAEHRRVIREACAARGGVEVDTQGDAFFFAFPTAPGAVAAASALTDAFAAGPIQVRVGLHTGTPLLTEEGYIGDDVQRTARIAGAGHGGQVLVSMSTASLADRNNLRDLGEHRLKDLSAPERIYQVGPGEFPPLRSLHRTNLPVLTTPFVGREREVVAVRELLAGPDVRLLTLTGPGGSGKSRLAAQVAGAEADEYPDGVWWVPLDATRDPELVLESAAQVLGTKRDIRAHVGTDKMLILFDCFEVVIEGAGSVAELLSACPNLKVLVTSRERLRLTGEHEYAVPPLAREEAVSFFAARARAIKPDFEADDAVAELCRRLDDMPLALELAAARVKVLSTKQLLDYGLPLASHGPRDLPDRQRSLNATIQWSYGLLTPSEQQLFRRFSVFVGGCTLEAAHRVVEADVEDLGSLVDKSLVTHAGERYRMLDTIREFAADCLSEAGESKGHVRAHAEYFLELVRRSGEERGKCAGTEEHWWRLGAVERGNLMAALVSFRELGEPDRELELAVGIGRYYPVATAPVRRAILLRALEGRNAATASHVARALWQLSELASIQGDVDEARELALEALARFRELDDQSGVARTLEILAFCSVREGDLDAAAILFDEAESSFRVSEDAMGLALLLANRSDVALRKRDYRGALALVEEASELCRSQGHPSQTFMLLNGAWALRGLGLLSKANTYARLGLERAAMTLNYSTIAESLVLMSLGHRDASRPAVAAQLLGAAEVLWEDEEGLAVPPYWEDATDELARTLGGTLGPELLELRATGRELEVDAVVRLALDSID